VTNEATRRPIGREEVASGSAQPIPPGLDAVLVLLRHGETEFIVDRRFQGQMEAPLSELGEQQAVLAGRRLSDVTASPPLPVPAGPPFAIVHSPLGRTTMTTELAVAEMWASDMDVPPLRADRGFTEIGQGEWEGLTDVQITERFGDSLANWRRWPARFHAPGGESLDDVRARVEAALRRLLTDLAAGTEPGTHDRSQVLGYEDESHDRRRWALIVGHGGVFRVVTCVLLGLPMDHFWNFDFGLAAITVIEIRAGRAVLRSLNLDGHLDGASALAALESSRRNERGAL
jgi:broad specificity phosphatase PhoE